MKRILSISLALFFTACTNNSDVEPVAVHRYDYAIMSLPADNPDSIGVALNLYADEYWVFLQGADLDDTNNIRQIQQFITDTQIIAVYKRIQSEYPVESTKLGTELAKAFSNIRNIFPQFKDPNVYTYISYFDALNRITYFDSILWIGLDLYVSNNTEQYSSFGIPQYLSARLSPDYLMPDIVRAAGRQLIARKQETTLLDNIVEEGKMMCFISSVLPGTKEYILFGYTPGEWAWCKRNESKIWEYLAKENLLYQTDPVRIRRFINDGPGGLALEGAPSRLTQFIGWRLVSRYLDNTDDNWGLLFESGTQEVLNVSKYKP
ncbi:MAG: hypothetical protein LBC49_01840 [Bacteroidales bacterium]|jgi:hypothetical protein|nr:hypothetical protein [Bacteroidales bacterium]